MASNGNSTSTRPPSLAEFLLAAFAGITLPLALAPGIYYAYFEAIGWPHPYITHNGPLWGTHIGDQLCWSNVALATLLPAVSLVLAVRRRKSKVIYLGLALVLIQFCFGLANMILLMILLD